jgi:hypothetical protein
MEEKTSDMEIKDTKKAEENSPCALDVVCNQSLNFVNFQAEMETKLVSKKNTQNQFSFLKKAIIVNNSAQDIKDAVLSVSFLPANLKCDNIYLSCLEKGVKTAVDAFNITVDPAYLYSLSEAVVGSIHFVLTDKEGNVLAETTKAIRLLPIGESASEDRIEEILASFVTPNDDYVKELARKTAAELQAKYGRSDLSDYQSEDPNEVLHLLDAAYLAIQKEHINYSNPPASFEKVFQRLRLPRELLIEKLGTCIDFSLLFASLMENLGLHPLIVVIDGHAFNGCWLTEQASLANPVDDNQTALINKSTPGSQKLVLINAVDASASNSINFNSACDNGTYLLKTADPFLYALDIQKCRDDYILPIPTPHLEGETKEIDFKLPDINNYQTRQIIDQENGVLDGSNVHQGKFDLWGNKLLDLDMNNKLINLHIALNTIQVLNCDSVKLFKTLNAADQPHFNLNFMAASQAQSDPKFAFFYFEDDLSRNTFQRDLSAGRLDLASKNGQPEQALITLARKSNTEFEDSGCNPLFLTLGALEWYPSGKNTSIYSPLILIPAKLPRRRSGEFFTLDLDMDGIKFNETLFEFFRQQEDLDFKEFTGLFDNSAEVDLHKVFNTVREKITSKHNWVLHENLSSLGLFSFAHYVMWSDLTNYRGIFLQNPVIASLADGKKEWEDPVNAVSKEELDQKVSPEDIAAPLSADSSQLEAILAAEEGQSFVLDGPPGTGKSQTIANMIVNFMYRGKKVLFVAEKEVALEVVKKRLDDLNLGSFCLEIHSAKANKKDVLNQLAKALEVGQTKVPSTFFGQALDLKNKRESLNKTLNSLHAPKGYFLSAYQAIILYLSNKDFKGNLSIEEAYAKQVSQDSFAKCHECLTSLLPYDYRLGGYAHNYFQYFTSRQYSMAKRDELFSKLPPIKDEAMLLNRKAKALIEKDSWPLPLTKNAVTALDGILIALRKDNKACWANWDQTLFLTKRAEITDYLTRSVALAAKLEKLSPVFKREVLKLDLASLYDQARGLKDLKLFQRLISLAKIRKGLKPYTVGKYKDKDLVSLLEGLLWAKKEEAALATADPYILSLFPDEYLASASLCSADLTRANNTYAILDLVNGIDGLTEEAKKELLAVVSKTGTEQGAFFANEVSEFLDAYSKLQQDNKTLKEAYGFDIQAGEENEEYYKKAAEDLTSALGVSGLLSLWTQFMVLLDTADSLLPPQAIDLYKEGKIGLKALARAYDADLGYYLAGKIISAENLGGLTSIDLDREIEKYAKAIEEFAVSTVQETAAKVTANYPLNGVNYAPSTQVTSLRRIVASGGRGISLRSLFTTYGDIIEKLCPCFLMSPLAVAQYLVPGKHSFDAVVFDEASQIPTSQAVGSIARAKSVIIAGDQQQMPPTDFFSSTSSLYDDDDSDNKAAQEEDLESLLDDAIALGLPRKRLNWHYRSHDESLIAFSNSRFYDNSLYTFPSPNNQVSSVSFRYVGGNYEKVRGINKEEAQAIVSEVMKRIKDPVLSRKSIGIVTFNEKQQTLIDDLLDKQFAADVSLNQKPGGEEIFVKNLENVQGDERDVILFSICFGPDKKTQVMPLNFGPLSLAKGERRLNVAVSRAREEMIVFSSVQPEEIRSAQAKNEGASFLRDFLSYAKNGRVVLTRDFAHPLTSPSISISDFIAQDLAKDGYQADIDVGTSAFRIDLGIKDPSDPAKYILGVICDSDSYCKLPTCRDRNVVEPFVLNRLHWNLMKVWSVEYLDHPDQLVLTIEETVKGLVEKNNSGSMPLEDSFIHPQTIKLEKKQTGVIYPEKKDYPANNYARRYHPNGNMDLKEVLENECPMSMDLLFKRYREYAKVARVGSQIERNIRMYLAAHNYRVYKNGGYEFIYSADSGPGDYKFFRVGGDRELNDIPFIELFYAMKDIIQAQGKMSREDLYKQVHSVFGFAVLTEKASLYLAKALDHWIEAEYFALDKNGLVTIAYQ